MAKREEGKCRQCRYSSWACLIEDGERLRCCMYIVRTGKRRPCKGGKECTAFEPKSNKAWPHDGFLEAKA